MSRDRAWRFQERKRVYKKVGKCPLCPPHGSENSSRSQEREKRHRQTSKKKTTRRSGKTY